MTSHRGRGILSYESIIQQVTSPNWVGGNVGFWSGYEPKGIFGRPRMQQQTSLEMTDDATQAIRTEHTRHQRTFEGRENTKVRVVPSGWRR